MTIGQINDVVGATCSAQACCKARTRCASNFSFFSSSASPRCSLLFYLFIALQPPVGSVIKTPLEREVGFFCLNLKGPDVQGMQLWFWFRIQHPMQPGSHWPPLARAILVLSPEDTYSGTPGMAVWHPKNCLLTAITCLPGYWFRFQLLNKYWLKSSSEISCSPINMDLASPLPDGRKIFSHLPIFFLTLATSFSPRLRTLATSLFCATCFMVLLTLTQTSYCKTDVPRPRGHRLPFCKQGCGIWWKSSNEEVAYEEVDFPVLVLKLMDWIINALDRWIKKKKIKKRLLSNMWHYLHFYSKHLPPSESVSKMLWHLKAWCAEAATTLQGLNTFLTHLIPTS